MKQYDINSEAPAYLPIEGVKGPHVLLSIEELRGVWNAGCKAMNEVNASEYDEDYVCKHPDFYQYLTSKGIELP